MRGKEFAFLYSALSKYATHIFFEKCIQWITFHCEILCRNQEILLILIHPSSLGFVTYSSHIWIVYFEESTPVSGEIKKKTQHTKPILLEDK